MCLRNGRAGTQGDMRVLQEVAITIAMVKQSKCPTAQDG